MREPLTAEEFAAVPLMQRIVAIELVIGALVVALERADPGTADRTRDELGAVMMLLTPETPGREEMRGLTHRLAVDLLSIVPPEEGGRPTP